METADIKHPNISVKLVGEDGNAMAVMGRVRQALRRGGVAKEEIDAYTAEAMSGDYDNVIETSTRWVNVE